jgi:hypothetical protein
VIGGGDDDDDEADVDDDESVDPRFNLQPIMWR